MLGFVAKRLAFSALSAFVLVVAVFFLARLTGDPADLFLPIDAVQSVRDEFAARYGFDDPILEQFMSFVAGLVRLDFGYSLYHNRPAIDVVLQAFPTTLLLAAYSMGISLIIAIVVGTLAARKIGGVFDRIATYVSLFSASAPNFWVAILGIVIFAVWLRWVPTSGTGGFQYWILPVAVLVLRPAGLLMQVVRGSMIAALSAPYIRTARAKGMNERRISFVHALRNSMLPVVTVAGDQAAAIVNGAVIVEVIFGFPGIGKLLLDSITYRDFAVLQSTILVASVAILLMNILIDMLYAALDPRIRLN